MVVTVLSKIEDHPMKVSKEEILEWVLNQQTNRSERRLRATLMWSMIRMAKTLFSTTI